jgi:hypothetical protein
MRLLLGGSGRFVPARTVPVRRLTLVVPQSEHPAIDSVHEGDDEKPGNEPERLVRVERECDESYVDCCDHDDQHALHLLMFQECVTRL